MYDFAYLEDGFDDGNNCRLEQHDVLLSALVKQGVAAAVASHGPCISAYTGALELLGSSLSAETSTLKKIDLPRDRITSASRTHPCKCTVQFMHSTLIP